MYLRGYPKYFVKGEKRRAVYYTIEASELLQSGWLPEEEASKPKNLAVAPEPEPLPEPKQELAEVEAEVRVEVEVVEDEPEEAIENEESDELPDFGFMTKAELIQYAAERGVELKPALTKAELTEACEAL